MNNKRRRITRTDEELLETAKKYKTRLEWSKKDHSSYCIAGRRGIRDKCAAHMGILGVRRSDEDIMNIAKKYKYLKDFRENETNIYAIAVKRNILKKICSHMVKHSKARALSDKEILNIGNKFRLKSQWILRSFPTFNEAKRRGLIEKSKFHSHPTLQQKRINKNGKGKNKKNRNE